MVNPPPGIPGNTGFAADTKHIRTDGPGAAGGGAGKAHPPKVPVAKGAKLDQDEVRALGAAMIGQLDTFLDEVAEGHRHAMDATVEWLTGYGDLDREIQRSVQALSPLLQKWSIEICFLLRMKDTLRFNELKDALPGIGSRTLSQRLKELEQQGIVERKAYAEVPVRVEYKLTPKGMRMGDLFLPVIAHLRITGWREGLEKRKAKA